MDLDQQAAILDLARGPDREHLMVVLGSPSSESARVYAETVTTGDPSWAGPLAGVSLKLPVYHILEDELKQTIPDAMYREHLFLAETALERDDIVVALRDLRSAGTQGE